MNLDIVFHRQQQAFADQAEQRRKRPDIEKRKLEAEARAGAEMYERGAISSETRRVLAECRDDLIAAEYCVERAAAGVAAAVQADMQETLQRWREAFIGLLDAREEAAAEYLKAMDAANAARARMQQIGADIVAVVGQASATSAADGLLVLEPSVPDLLQVPAMEHGQAVRESSRLLTYFDTAGVSLVEGRMRQAFVDAQSAEQFTNDEAQET